MSLANHLKDTANNLIATYGNTVTLVSTTNDGEYDPQTGTYKNSTATTITKKALKIDATTSVMNKSGLPETSWGSVSAIYEMVADSDIDGIDNTWTIDGGTIVKKVITEAQDSSIIVNLYVGT